MFENIKAINNPNQCEGYMPGMVDIEKTNQLDFYLPDTNTTDAGDDLACSLIPAASGEASKSKFKVGNASGRVRNALEELDRSKPLVLILHGHRSWRNQIIFCKLASEISSSLSCHTLRFDFSANGQSKFDKDLGLGEAGERHRWRYCTFDRDHADLLRVLKFVEDDLKIKVSCIISHSNGSAASLRYASENDGKADAGPVYVNLSGAYYGHTKHNYEPFFSDVMTPQKKKELRYRGFSIMEVKGGRKLELRTSEIEKRDKLDMHSTFEKIKNAKVLTIHGDKDPVHDISNAHRFNEVLPKENHTMLILPGANHVYNGLKYFKTMMFPAIQEFIQANSSN